MIVTVHEFNERVFDIPARTKEEALEIFERTVVADLIEVSYDVISRMVVKIEEEAA